LKRTTPVHLDREEKDMDVEKLFRDAENSVSYTVRKGPYIRALCKELRRLIPDDQTIMLDLGDSGVTEVNGIDIGVHLLCLMKDIPDTAEVIDPRPCDKDANGDSDYSDKWETDLSSIGLVYPE
jgi:hypothetical protein